MSDPSAIINYMPDDFSIPEFPDLFRIRLLSPAEAGIYDFDVLEGPDAEDSGLAIPLSTRHSTGSVVIWHWTPPQEMDSESADALSMLLRAASNTVDMLTCIYRRIHLHPGRHGFVPHSLPNRRQATHGSWQSSGTVLERFSQFIPSYLWDNTRAWFPVDSDPTRFGQFYLVPSADISDVQWEMHQVGIHGDPLATAAWDAQEEFARLCEACENSNPDHQLTLQALEDAEKVRQSRRKHEFATAVQEAREAFSRKKDQIRPRLSESAVHTVLMNTAPVTQGRRTVRAALQIHDLVPYEVFGYRYQREALPGIYAGAEVLFYGNDYGPKSVNTDEDFHIQFAQTLQGALAERNLGTLYWVTYDNARHLWLFKNGSMGQQHHAAFLIPPDAEWSVAAP